MLVSEDSRQLLWAFDAAKLDSLGGIFKVEPLSGVLAGGESVTVKAYFTPMEAVAYTSALDVFLDDDYSRPYSTIQMKGVGIHPMLSFDRREVGRTIG